MRTIKTDIKNGVKIELNEMLNFTNSLGKKVCLFRVDTSKLTILTTQAFTSYKEALKTFYKKTA
jgi:hypothetical protein